MNINRNANEHIIRNARAIAIATRPDVIPCTCDMTDMDGGRYTGRCPYHEPRPRPRFNIARVRAIRDCVYRYTHTTTGAVYASVVNHGPSYHNPAGMWVRFTDDPPRTVDVRPYRVHVPVMSAPDTRVHGRLALIDGPGTPPRWHTKIVTVPGAYAVTSTVTHAVADTRANTVTVDGFTIRHIRGRTWIVTDDTGYINGYGTDGETVFRGTLHDCMEWCNDNNPD